MKNILILFLFIFLTGCSLDTKSGMWNEKKLNNKILALSNDDLNENLTLEQYELAIIDYAKKSKFPDINVD